MTALELMALAEPLAKLYTGLETDLMNNIAVYLAEQSLETSTAKWKINKLAQLGALDKSNIKTISEYSSLAPTLLEEALTNASLTAINDLETGFMELVKDGILNATTVPIEDSMANAIKTFYNQAVDKYNLVNTVMQYKSKSIAQKLINDTAELANKQEFLDMLNKATGKVVTGIESRTSALRQCISEMTAKGIPAFTDKLGRQWSPEAYVNMDIRTTCSNVANKSQFDRMDAYGISLMEISSHSGARPKCAKYQGTIVDRSGKSKKYKALSATSYGEPDGLFGINCGHKPYPYIEGVSTQRYFPYDEEENTKQYKKFQQQRQLERNVRSAKRECMAMDKLGDKDGFTKASAKLKASQSKLKQYCTDNNLSYKADRTATAGYGKSISSKVVQANKTTLQKQIDKASESGIIKKKDIVIGRSVGAKAKNYDVMLPDGTFSKLVEGSTITDVEVFAGKGAKDDLRVKHHLESNYGGKAENWQHTKGRGYVECNGEPKKAMLHWFEEESVGIVEMFVKGWSKK